MPARTSTFRYWRNCFPGSGLVCPEGVERDRVERYGQDFGPPPVLDPHEERLVDVELAVAAAAARPIDDDRPRVVGQHPAQLRLVRPIAQRLSRLEEVEDGAPPLVDAGDRSA